MVTFALHEIRKYILCFVQRMHFKSKKLETLQRKEVDEREIIEKNTKLFSSIRILTKIWSRKSSSFQYILL